MLNNKCYRYWLCGPLQFRRCLQGLSRFIMLAFVFLFFASPARAQVERGAIAGRVLDASGAAVPDCRIVLSHLDSNAGTEAACDEKGFYTVAGLAPGTYRASFSHKGFKTAERSGIKVAVAQQVWLDVMLVTGEISETVEVTDVRILHNAGSPLLSTVIDNGFVQDLPLSISGGRRIENFAYAMAPSAEGDEWTSHIAGTPAFTKEVMIDGLTATSQIQGNVLETSPTVESIKEFGVQTSGLSAEYGRAGGGVFNFVLKSGTNAFSGNAYYYGRNEALNANSWMNNWQLSRTPSDMAFRRARDRQSVMGGSAGGPVVIPGIYNGRNRTFLFGTFEHYAQQRMQTGKLDRTVPVPEFLEGDFSRLLTENEIGQDALGRSVYAGQIFDPLTMRQVGAKWVSDPFPGNIIPKARMSTVSGKVIGLYRDGYQPMMPSLLTNNSAGPQYESPWFHESRLTLKADHAVTNAWKLSGSLIWTERPRMLLDQGGVWNPGVEDGSGGPLSRARKQEVTSRAIRLSIDGSLSANLISTTGFVFNRYRNNSMSAQAEGNWHKYLGMQSSTGAGLFPEIGFGSAVNGIGTTPVGYSGSDFSVANNYVFSEAVSWNAGRHLVKFGGEFWAQQMNSHEGYDTLHFDFSNSQTGIPGYSWSNRVGFGFASFFLGEAGGGSKNVPFDLYGRRKYVSLFFNDEYRLNHSVTLNFGLRWEQSQPLKEKYGRWAGFNPGLLNTALGVKGALEFVSGPGDSLEKRKDWKEFGPRIGAAYRITDRIVLRAGYGLSYIPLGLNFWSGVPYGFAPGYRGTNTQPISSTLARFNWDQGYADNYRSPIKDANELVYGMVSVDEQSLNAGYMHQYNAGLQYQIGQDAVLDIAFMGNDGRRLHNGALKRNQPSAEAYQNDAVDPWSWVWDPDSAAAAGVSYPYSGFSNYAGVALQPFPHVSAETAGPVYYVGVPAGSSAYRSLQLSLTRRFSGSIDAVISYNLSRTTGNSESAFDETWDAVGMIQDVNDLEKEAGTVAGFDQTHVFKGAVSFSLPFGRGRRYSMPMVDSILGGWRFSWMFRYNSGVPLTVYSSAWYPGWEGAVYPDFNRSAGLKGQFDSSGFNPAVPNTTANLYFNPAAFSNPKGHRLGNGKRYYSELRGFGYSNEDLAISRNFRVGERAGFQMRAEFLNVFNRHHFADPNTSMGDPSTFGYVTALTGTPRVMQFGLRLNW